MNKNKFLNYKSTPKEAKYICLEWKIIDTLGCGPEVITYGP